jgi:dihydrofolate synthase/folylpolyglutamate synthase
MAFLHFARRRVDAAVLEVGLGGRLDSTNVCQPEVCIITNISFDHVKQLGNTLAAIASEKAGIIKPGVPVVAGELAAEPRATIAAKAAELGAPLYERGTAYNFCSTPLPTPHSEFPTPRFALTTPDAPLTTPIETLDYVEPAHHPSYRLDGVRLAMLGRHQAANAAAAICAANRLRSRGWSISDEQLRRGLAAARCSGRMEQLSASPAVIVDVAHNVAAIEALLAALGERYAGRRRIAIFASSKDKDYRGMLRRVLGSFDVVILTQYVNNPRAMEAEGLLAVALELRAASGDPSQPRLHALVRPPDAWHLAQAIAGADDLVCITGSFFLVAELRPLVLASERSGLRRAAAGQST